MEPLALLDADSATLVRSVRARVALSGLVTERLEPRGDKRAELVFLAQGAELARLLLKAGTLPRLSIAGAEPEEISGLASAQLAADKIRALADARALRIPQLDLFGGKGR